MRLLAVPQIYCALRHSTAGGGACVAHTYRKRLIININKSLCLWSDKQACEGKAAGREDSERALDAEGGRRRATGTGGYAC
jgi:hypothetical protein